MRHKLALACSFGCSAVLSSTACAAENDLGQRFAIECTGSSVSRHSISGTLHEDRDDLGTQIFVIDPDANTVVRALFPRQEFDPVCGTSGLRFVSIAPGLVLVDSNSPASEQPVTSCEFKVSRMSGDASYALHMEWNEGRYLDLDWSMTCKKTEIPTFDTSNRKF